MLRPITSTAFLLVASTLLAALLPSVTTAEILTHQSNSVVGSTSTSLHKTWGKFIHRQSLMTQSADLPVSDAATNNSRLSTTYRLSKLPCFVQRLSTTPQQLSSPLLQHKTRQSMIDVEWSLATGQIITKIRGGGASADDDSGEEEYDATDDESSSEEEDEYDSEYDEEYDSEYEDESDDEEETDQQDNIVSSLTSSSLKSSLRAKSISSDDETQIQQYDDVLAPPAMQQLVISLGVMFLSQRIDILDTKTVRIARFAFVAYIVTMQIFLLYVRLRAKAINDRTEITLSNPLASLVQGAAGGAAGGGGGNFMVKALADQMLSSTTTIYEYDLSQAKKMNSGLLMPMIFLYFLHFKMKQVQPLLMQTATGVMNLIYSPLFQVYVLGRNLERPFKAAAGNSMMDALQAGQQEESGGSSEVEEVEQDDADEEEEDAEEESDTGEEESDGDESEYDTDEE